MFIICLQSSTPVFDSPAYNNTMSTNQTIQRLTQQVKQLQNENLQLRRGKYGGFTSASLTDLSNISFSEMVGVIWGSVFKNLSGGVFG